MLRDLMIDIETVSTSPRAAVLTIGAQYFDPKSDEKGATFYAQISVIDALQHGDQDDSTMKWWSSSQVNPVARREAFSGVKSALEVADDFAAFAKGCKPWGNGSVFDVIILENWFKVLRVPVPWKFWDIRDVRTVVDMAGGKPKIEFDGMQHIAIDDAMHEVELVQACYQKIFKKEDGPHTMGVE